MSQIVQIIIDSNYRFSTKEEEQEYLKLPHNKYGWIRCIGEIINDDLYYKNKKVLSMSDLRKHTVFTYCPNDKSYSQIDDNTNISDENIKNYDNESDSDSQNDDDNESNSDNDSQNKSDLDSDSQNDDLIDNSEICSHYKNNNACIYCSVFLADDELNQDIENVNIWRNEIYLDNIKITDAWLMLCIYDD